MVDYADLSADLEQRRVAHLYRRRQVVQSPQGVELTIDGRRYINFCSNDYLGLASHPELIEAFSRAARDYGVGSGAAHLITGHSEQHHYLEQELAAFTGYPRVLLFSTGYMANLGVVSALVGQGDAVFEDRLNHASLLDAGLLSRARLQRYTHLDSADLAQKIAASKARRTLICTDGVFSMDGDMADVTGLARVANEQQAWLMVDDAHGLGVIGKTGRGTLEEHGLGVQQVPILMGTFGKAFGTFGAFVAADEVVIETLIQKARPYIYTTALPPAVAAATRTALRLVQSEGWRREHLQALITQFRHGAAELGLNLMSSASAIQPLMIGDAGRAVSLSEKLKQRGLLISAIRPPTVPEGTARLRITLSAAHSTEQVEHLLQTLDEVLHA